MSPSPLRPAGHHRPRHRSISPPTSDFTHPKVRCLPEYHLLHPLTLSTRLANHRPLRAAGHHQTIAATPLSMIPPTTPPPSLGRAPQVRVNLLPSPILLPPSTLWRDPFAFEFEPSRTDPDRVGILLLAKQIPRPVYDTSLLSIK